MDNTVLEFGERLFETTVGNNFVSISNISVRACEGITSQTPSYKPVIIVFKASLNDSSLKEYKFSLDSEVDFVGYRGSTDKDSKCKLIFVMKYRFIVSDKYGNKYIYGVCDINQHFLDKFESDVVEELSEAFNNEFDVVVNYKYSCDFSQLYSRNEYNCIMNCNKKL